MAEICFIGTGDAFGSGGRRNSAILLRSEGKTLLLDCGPTTLGGLKLLGIGPTEIDAVAISHFHGDHLAGLPFLLLEYVYESPRRRPLPILGPPGIEERVDELERLYAYDLADRPFERRYSEFRQGRAQEVEGFRITPVPAHHHPETRPHMLRIENGGRTIFFSGDTGWHEEMPDRVGDADLLISECVFFEEGFEYHLSHERLRRERNRFRCQRVVLTHLGSEVLENRDRVEFETADDGMRLKI